MGSSQVTARERIYTHGFGRAPDLTDWPKSYGERYTPFKFMAQISAALEKGICHTATAHTVGQSTRYLLSQTTGNFKTIKVVSFAVILTLNLLKE